MGANAPSVSKEFYLKQAGFNGLPSGWSVVQASELLSEDRGISVGVMYPGKHDPNGIPLIKAGDLSGGLINPTPGFRITPNKHHEYRRTEFMGGEILMTLVGDIGQCAVVPPEMRGWNSARAVAVIRLASPTDALFVRLCFLSRQLQHLMQAWANTTVQPTLNLKEIRQLPLPWPPKRERDAIANILGTLDDKIELNRRMNETLEAMARALFKSWFVDFDPVRAKMDGKQPKGMSPEIAALFPDGFEHVDGELVPKGWGVGFFADQIEILSGGTPKTSVAEYWDGEIPWYTVKDAPADSDVWVMDTERHVSKVGVDNSASSIFDEGVTIISARGTVGKIALTGVPMAMNQSCYGIRGCNGYPAFFTHYNLRAAIGELQQRTHGTVFDTITRQTFLTLNCCYPTVSIALIFDEQVSDILNRIRSNTLESQTLADLRDTLLPKLLSGEIRVGDAERAVEEVI